MVQIVLGALAKQFEEIMTSQTSGTAEQMPTPRPAQPSYWLLPLTAVVVGYVTAVPLSVAGIATLAGIALCLWAFSLPKDPLRVALVIWSLVVIGFGAGAGLSAFMEHMAVRSAAEDRVAIAEGESRVLAAFPTWTGATEEEGQALLWSGSNAQFVLSWGHLQGDRAYYGTILAKSAGGRFFELDARTNRKDSSVVFSNLKPIAPAAAIRTLLGADRRDLLERFALPQTPA